MSVSSEIQEEVNKIEDLEDAVVEVKQDLAIEEQQELANETFWSKFCKWFCSTVKRIVQIACTLLKAEVLFIINNPYNQNQAKVAVLAAIKLGLTSHAAWEAAWKVLLSGKLYISDGVAIEASKIRTNILETLLQLVYTCIAQKNQQGVLKNETTE